MGGTAEIAIAPSLESGELALTCQDEAANNKDFAHYGYGQCNVLPFQEDTPTLTEVSDDVSTVDSLGEDCSREPWSERCDAPDAPWAPAEKLQAHGKHSRFRKDLVNLNKAVIKWLGQEQEGQLDRVETEHRIKHSIVVQKLREAHGPLFELEQFVAQAIERGARLVRERNGK